MQLLLIPPAEMARIRAQAVRQIGNARHARYAEGIKAAAVSKRLRKNDKRLGLSSDNVGKLCHSKAVGQVPEFTGQIVGIHPGAPAYVVRSPDGREWHRTREEIKIITASAL
jgi:hypothetical protein